jgi:hypothetical protein
MREMVAKQGDEWLRQGDGWQSREMGGLVGSPPACSLGSIPNISQKYKMGEISKGVATHSSLPTKKLKKNYFSNLVYSIIKLTEVTGLRGIILSSV